MWIAHIVHVEMEFCEFRCEEKDVSCRNRNEMRINAESGKSVHGTLCWAVERTKETAAKRNVCEAIAKPCIDG